MVRGLDLFRERFSDFADRYILIGGTACDLLIGEVGLQFRATKDLDIVLCVEALDREFAEAFWDFVKAGNYQVQETAAGSKRFYRFRKPADPEYPVMLELFSRVPEALSIAEGSHLTPIPIDEAVSSLSAILLDDAYYEWIHAGKEVIEGVPIVGPGCLIPLKARAWLDLTARREAGESIDSKDIRKHRNDIIRLFQVIEPDARLDIPEAVAQDMDEFLGRMFREKVELKALGITGKSLEEIVAVLRNIYGIG